MFSRFEDWERRLDEFLQAAETREFRYGEWDCSLFATAAIDAITGVNVALALQGRYIDLESGKRVLCALTQTETWLEGIEAIARIYDLPEISPSFLRRGDVALVRVGDIEALAVVGLDGKLIALTEKGTFKLPRQRALKGWAVGWGDKK